MNPTKRFILNILVWFDEGLNTLTGGDPGETVSSRAEKARQNNRKWGCVLCWVLDKIQKNHCKIALEKYAGSDAVIADGR